MKTKRLLKNCTLAEIKNDKVYIKNLSLDQLYSILLSVEKVMDYYEGKEYKMKLYDKLIYFSLSETVTKINLAYNYSRKTLIFTIPQAISFYIFFIHSDYVATPVHYISSLIHQKLI